MSITDNYSPDKSVGNGSTVIFTGNWSPLSASYMRVYLELISTGVQTLVDQGGAADQYTLSFDQSGYIVTMNTAPTSDYNLIRARDVSIDQTVPYKTSKGWQGIVNEDSYDKITAIAQDQQDQIDRTPKFPIGSSVTNAALPEPIDGYGLIWDGVTGVMRNTSAALFVLEGNAAIVAANITNINTVAGIGANVTSVAGNAANINIVAGIAADVSTVSAASADVIIVAADLLGADTIGTVATKIADVTSAATNMAAIIAAPTQASNAAASALLAESWAIDDIGDRPAGSAKYWAEQSALSASGSGVGYSILGRASGTTGSRTDIVAGTDGHVLLRNGTTLEFGNPLATNITVSDTSFSTLTGTDAQTVLDDVDDVLSELPSVTEIREIPQNSQSVAYELVLSDGGKHILHPSADTTARTYTIPANASVAFPIGTAITFINQNSAGVLTIAITTDTMRLAGDGTTGSRTLAANGMATAVKVTATEWIISGTGLT